MKNKSIIIIISVILVLSVIGVGFLISSNQNKNKEILANQENSQEEIINQNSQESNMEEIGNSIVNISDWLIKENNTVNFSFHYPQNAKIIDEGNCYRVEYGLGFVIFFLPIEGDMRCGARTGVGVLPDNVDVTDYLKIEKMQYEAPGFNAIIDTKGEKFFRPETRYLYDFYYMFNLNREENCKNASECKRVVYGIYKETGEALDKENINDTMNTLRAIIESIDIN